MPQDARLLPSWKVALFLSRLHGMMRSKIPAKVVESHDFAESGSLSVFLARTSGRQSCCCLPEPEQEWDFRTVELTERHAVSQELGG